MATKLVRVVTYDKGNSPTMSHDPVTTLSREITLQFKSSIVLVPQSLLLSNLTGSDL